MASVLDSQEERRCMRQPLLSNPKGGFRALPFILANEAFERVASVGLLPNMILYLTREYGMESTQAAYVVFFWSSATYFAPIIAAFLADSYFGRFPMIGFGSIVSFLGMVVLWLTTMITPARYPPCNQDGNTVCISPIISQLLLYSSFGLMSIGAGGIRSSSLAFGADQLDKRESLKSSRALESYFSWYYVCTSLSAIVAVTCVVYIQENMGWKVGFGVPAMLMFLSALSFFLASSFYVKPKTTTYLLTGFARVLAASYKNREIELPSQDTNILYHHIKGSIHLVPSDKLRFLNKACIIKHTEKDLTTDGRALNPWNLCTVDEVEELKALIKVIPLWTTGIMLSVIITSQNSFQVLQAASMDRHITSNFEIPAGSFTTFMIMSLTGWIVLYDRIIIPLASNIAGKPSRLSLKQRMGIGLLISCAAMIALGVVEKIRREMAIREGFLDEPKAIVNMSAMWLLPHYILSGVAEALNAIAQNEFYYTELPKSMSSVASTLFGLGMSAAYLVSSFILSSVDAISKGGGNESWVSNNINKGHYDYYYWLIAGLSLINFMYYVACCRAYGPCKENGSKVSEEGLEYEILDQY